MLTNEQIADIALSGDVSENLLKFKERRTMKVKTTFYTRKKGKEFDPVIHTVFPESRADQISYTPTADLVDQMFKTGKMVQAAKQLYDFEDGKDDGRDVPVDRARGIELPEVSMLMAENSAKLEKHKSNLKAMAESDRPTKEEEAPQSDDKAPRSDEKASGDKKSD